MSSRQCRGGGGSSSGAIVNLSSTPQTSHRYLRFTLRSSPLGGGSGGIEPMWDKSYVDPACFDWHREGQLDPLLGKLQSEQGASAVWAFGLACLEPLRSTHHLLPKLLQAAPLP